MDLLNYQYLDKMNNNIGRLHYEGNVTAWHSNRLFRFSHPGYNNLAHINANK